MLNLILSVVFLMFMICPSIAQEANAPLSNQEESVMSDEGVATNEESGDMVEQTEDEVTNDEGYGISDDEYNEAEANTQIPDEYFDDDNLGNEEAAVAEDINADSPVDENIAEPVVNDESVPAGQ